MIFTDIGYAATALFALAVAALAALAWLAWRADRHDPLTVVIAEPPPLLSCPTGCGDPGCAGDCTWVTADALAALRVMFKEDGRG